MSKSVLVTGGAGYLGSILVPALLRDGHRVHVVDNFRYRQNCLAACCADPNFSVTNGDVRDERTMAPLTKDADIIVPLAAYVGAPLCNSDPIGSTSTNRDAIVAMLKTLSASQWVLYPTTNSGYGIGESGKFCTEDTPLRPISRYGRDKVDSEAAILERENSISFRLATVFGMAPRMRIDLLVNDFTYRAVYDRFVVLFEAHFKRNYLHVRDVSRAFQHGIANFAKMRGQAYNVGLSEANLSKAELCEAIKKQIPSFVYMEAPIGEDPDKRDYIVSNEKIERTGFAPAHKLDQGIAELIKGYRMIRDSIFNNL
jgi:nucleoside-diphosphate-sugar epimerase